MAAALTELVVGDDPEAWAAAGFSIHEACTQIGSVTIRLVGSSGPRGVLAWNLADLDLGPSSPDEPATLDGLPTTTGPARPVEAVRAEHPNGIVAIDHVVVTSPDLARTIARLESLGIEARRTRDVGTPAAPRQQVFFWIGEPILELVGPATPTGDGPARIYGLAMTSPDLDATAGVLGESVGRVKEAVQPGRRITTLRHRDLGLSVPVAIMSPHEPIVASGADGA